MRLFAACEEIREQEGRTLDPSLRGPAHRAWAPARSGLEFIEQAPDLEAVIVPIGGGGLAAGASTAIRLAKPDCRIFGVEPFGADTMYRSFAAGSPQAIEKIDTIADSLGAPLCLADLLRALPRAASTRSCASTDAEMIAAMRFLLEHARLAVEPAGAAATAALLGPLRERLAGRRVGLIVCGSNIVGRGLCPSDWRAKCLPDLRSSPRCSPGCTCSPSGVGAGLLLTEYWLCRRMPDRTQARLLGQVDLGYQLALIGEPRDRARPGALLRPGRRLLPR